MKNLIVMIAIIGVAFCAQTMSAQDFPGASEVAKEHDFLKKFVGEWDAVSEGSGMKGEALMKCSMLGDLWLINSSEHKVGGMEMKSIQTIGFDTKKKKYVGTWADSMVNYMWQYEGTVDETGRKLTLNARGPSMTGEGMSDYQDAYEFKNDDTIIATSSIKGDDGKWTVMMTGTAKRRKKE